ncbi:MAG TPA: DUF2203 domain-containing protein [Bryobacteraceae bacterium]|nr:DUF2203 domain-containing protein [Bryobacteraceae bacterium]
MPRYFTLQQAEKLLPEVESAIREAIQQKSVYQKAEEEWQSFTSRVTLLGGVRVDHSQVMGFKQRKESSAQRLKAAVEKIQDYGCLLKDLDVGLLDFPTLFRGEEVYLCWKLGESAIEFWHGVNEGFRGRKAIDAEFLAEHRGE